MPKIHPSYNDEDQVSAVRDCIVNQLSQEADAYLVKVDKENGGFYPHPDPGSYSKVEYEADLGVVNDYINHKLKCIMLQWNNERAVWGDPETVDDLHKLAQIGAAVVQKKLLSQLRLPLIKPTPSSEPSILRND